VPVQPVQEPQPAQPIHEHGEPLFMGTTEGKRYKESQDAKMKAFEEETLRIEDELARTAQELEQTNTQLIALRQGFGQKDKNTGSKK
jgi:hypothetical protein